ncbi:DoxX family protein [Luteococcus peritonei]|uniref:DoxX family protein n=1 Tax=Luteococcus peritonei TaxID=88874 RepID=A0ABW4RVK5_9ACTN
MINPVKFVARGLLASVFIGGGMNQLKNPAALGPVVERAKEKYGVDLPVDGKDLVTANGAGMVAAGTAMALGIMPRTSALALAGLLVPTNVVGHPFWEQTDPGKKMHESSSFMANAAIIGGLLMVAMDRRKK